MKRAEGLVISRREFCAFAGLAVVASCTDGDVGVVQTGPLGGGDDDAPPDGPQDASTGPDASTLPMCTGNASDVGAPATFALDAPVYFSNGRFFVVRDAGGLYALTSSCTHEGATCVVNGSDFRCPRHNAHFTFNGAVISGPVIQPLKHFAMCTLPNGHVGVTTTVVSASTRLAV